MAAGRWPSRAAAPERTPARPLPSPASRAGQAKRLWAEALPGRCAPLSLGPRRPKTAVGQLISSGLAQ